MLSHRQQVRYYSKTRKYRYGLGTKFYSGLDRFRVFAFGEEQPAISTIDMMVIILGVSSLRLQMIGGYMQIN